MRGVGESNLATHLGLQRSFMKSDVSNCPETDGNSVVADQRDFFLASTFFLKQYNNK
jgi:hypothetical protein